MGQTPPKLAITFVDSPRGLGVTFLNLVFKEIVWFEHYNHHDKMSPAWTGLFSKVVTRRAGICSADKLRSSGPLSATDPMR